MKRNWQEITFNSEYLAAVEIKKALEENELSEVELGLRELLNTMARSERRALFSQLVRLMMHIIKWEIQPKRRSGSWALTILHAREEIEGLREEMPSLTREYVESIWDKSLNAAKRQAEAETSIISDAVNKLSWQDVFEKEYELPLKKESE